MVWIFRLAVKVQGSFDVLDSIPQKQQIPMYSRLGGKNKNGEKLSRTIRHLGQVPNDSRFLPTPMPTLQAIFAGTFRKIFRFNSEKARNSIFSGINAFLPNYWKPIMPELADGKCSLLGREIVQATPPIHALNSRLWFLIPIIEYDLSSITVVGGRTEATIPLAEEGASIPMNG